MSKQKSFDSLSTAAPTIVARLVTAEATARRIADLVSETLDPHDIATAAFERDDGSWEVAIHFRRTPDQAELRGLIASAAGSEIAAALTLERVAPRDWVAASLEGLAPVRAGRFCVHGAHDRARVPVNALGVEIEAALAFGTGHHGTTRGCLLALGEVMKRQRAKPLRILDIGTGTGVLAIAAAKGLRQSLRTPILATDIDPRAVQAARGNARLNKVASSVTIIRATGFADRRIATQRYDLIFANILLRPLQLMAAQLARSAAPGACVILSGLLVRQAPAALAAYRAQGLHLDRRILCDGWATLLLTKGRRPGR